MKKCEGFGSKKTKPIAWYRRIQNRHQVCGIRRRSLQIAGTSLVRRYYARKICQKQAFWVVSVGLYRGGKDRYCMKLIFVKVIAVFIECIVLDIRRDDGIERKVGDTVIGFAFVIIFFKSIHNIGIIVPHNQLLSKSQVKPELFRANTADYAINKAKSLFSAHNIYICRSKNLVRCISAEVHKIFPLLKEKNSPPEIERIGEI